MVIDQDIGCWPRFLLMQLIVLESLVPYRKFPAVNAWTPMLILTGTLTSLMPLNAGDAATISIEGLGEAH